MSDAYDKISKVWLQFPKELENSTLYDDLNNLKSKFENKKHFFGKYLTKIVIIGNVSTGKSTLINTLIGKEYFVISDEEETIAFFYCSLSEKNYEYFTLNDCQFEYKDISILKYAAKLNANISDFIDENSIINVYVKHDENKILDMDTVIVDCPGLGHDLNCDKQIAKHCSNADIIIFMFEINKPANLNQSNYIKTIRDNYKVPTCFFVYNKCDLVEFNDQKKITLKKDFFELFGEQSFRNFISNNNPLYFISALEPNKHEDFSRLKTDLMAHKKVNIIRFANVQSIFSTELKEFSKSLRNFVFNERKKKISIFEDIDKIKLQTNTVNEKYSGFQKYVKRRIENCKINLQINKIFEIIFKEIEDYKGTCYRADAPQMISRIEEIIRSKVNEFIEKHINNMCIDPINKRILEVYNNNPTEITIDNDMDYNISRDVFTIPNYEKIKNIFWYFEYGDKTVKVKESYTEFIKSTTTKEQINESIMNLYKNEFFKIESIYENLLESTKNEHVKTKENLLNENLRRLEQKLAILADYEKDVYENEKVFNSSFK